ncbi:MAG: hypothetical protein KBS83_09175, partial [Lachnospiraceae bacterium]|nr:hypothetical protein [Candidatus Equihabitans merdae]
ALPYLKRKMKAYGLDSSLDKASQVDLMNRYKEMSAVFGMPSYHLQDFMTFLEMPSEASMPEIFQALMSMESYRQALQIKLEEVELMDGEMPVFRYSVPYTFPKSISYRDGIYHIRFSGDTVSISMPIEDNSLRVYFTDPSEYYYLPQEGYAVHKSLSDFVDPSHRVKATRETCFTRLAFDDSFQKNKRRQINYLTSLISYLSVPFK